MPDAFLNEIAKQGLGYLLFAGSLIVIFFLYRENRNASQELKDLAEKRITDLKEVQANYTNSISAIKAVADNTLTIVENLQTMIGIKQKM